VAFNDLREWIDDRGGCSELALGAITREVSSRFGPARLFDNIKHRARVFASPVNNGTGTASGSAA
jgi:hypothetical protein